MKQTALLTLFLTWVAIRGFSQITLTSADLAGVGDVIYNTTPMLTVSLPPPGSSETYNFMMADSVGVEDTAYYVLPSNTPFGAQMTGANLAEKRGFQYTYYEKSASSFNLRGLVFVLPDLGGVSLPIQAIPLRFNPAVPLLNFPATMGMNIKSQSSARFEFDYDTNIAIGPITAHVTKVAIIGNIKDTSIIDGYGTANFVGGSLPCLRNSNTQKLTFSVEVLAQFSPFLPAAWVGYPIDGLPEYYNTSYLFWAEGKKAPIATLNVDTTGNLTSATFQSQLLRMPTSVLPRSAGSAFEFYPNPSQGAITWSGDKALKFVEIFSVDGRKITSRAVPQGATSVQLGDLKNGIYWAEFGESAGGRWRKKLIVNR